MTQFDPNIPVDWDTPIPEWHKWVMFWALCPGDCNSIVPRPKQTIDPDTHITTIKCPACRKKENHLQGIVKKAKNQALRVLSKELGRPLFYGESVKFKDGYIFNHHPTNLILIKS